MVASKVVSPAYVASTARTDSGACRVTSLAGFVGRSCRGRRTQEPTPEGPEEGPATTPGFFADHPRFTETSTTAAGLERLSLRHRALIEPNRDILAGARVLDIASHDGRWSLAALEAGAAHVTGIEARPEVVDHAEKTFQLYGTDPGSYRFVTGDVFGVLARERFEVDVIQCFGFLYHTLRYPELFSLLRRLEPRHLLIDTRVANVEGKMIEVYINNATYKAHAAVDDYTEGLRTVCGSPSPEALRMMLRVYGFRVESEYDWDTAGGDAGQNLIAKYRSGERISWRCRWQPPQASNDEADD